MFSYDICFVDSVYCMWSPFTDKNEIDLSRLIMHSWIRYNAVYRTEDGFTALPLYAFI